MAVREPHAEPARALQSWHRVLSFTTTRSQHFLDITDAVAACCAEKGLSSGLVTVQSRHTTAAVVLQENEPLLLEDLARVLERVAPRSGHYCHNDLEARTEVPPDERPNGHSHARALLLPSSAHLVVTGGRLDLGRWQRLFLVELDGPRRRHVSVMALGLGVEDDDGLRLVGTGSGP
jgi:secondary thiamine-phosphate synthase enzyme